jgi:hypothetical protein
MCGFSSSPSGLTDQQSWSKPCNRMNDVISNGTHTQAFHNRIRARARIHPAKMIRIHNVTPDAALCTPGPADHGPLCACSAMIMRGKEETHSHTIDNLARTHTRARIVDAVMCAERVIYARAL